LDVDLEEALQAPGLDVARPREQLLVVAQERLGMGHGRVLEDPHARVGQGGVVELLRGRARPGVRVRTNRRTRTPRRAACSMRRIMPRSVM
jgi:hypothetical protein